MNRNNKQEEIAITPVWSAPDNCYKIGIWVRDSAQGIGTITYYNPYSDKFGALGHGVYDIDTKELMNIKGGVITHSNISEVKKGEKGVPGELLGTSEKSQVLGEIKINTDVGLYGKINENKKKYFSNEPVSIAMQTEIQEGPATILTNISGDQIESYEVQIESVNHYSKNDSKGMVIKITDKNLLTKTGGIVQGMSGSPIMQNGKLIGAITHVFVQDPTKGYGIFIENMLKEEEKAVA